MEFYHIIILIVDLILLGVDIYILIELFKGGIIMAFGFFTLIIFLIFLGIILIYDDEV